MCNNKTYQLLLSIKLKWAMIDNKDTKFDNEIKKLQIEMLNKQNNIHFASLLQSAVLWAVDETALTGAFLVLLACRFLQGNVNLSLCTFFASFVAILFSSLLLKI